MTRANIRMLAVLRVATFGFLLLAAPFATGDPIIVPGTSVSFVPPDGFTPLTQQELDLKFPSKNSPAQAVGNERRSTTIAYEVKNTALASDQLSGTLEAMVDTLSRIVPGHMWVEKKLTSIRDLEWVYLEFKSNAIDTQIHNIILFTSWEGQMLIFNFNATAADFQELEPALRASIHSLAKAEV
jgi:hypothetical protein